MNWLIKHYINSNNINKYNDETYNSDSNYTKSDTNISSISVCNNDNNKRMKELNNDKVVII